MNKDDWDDGVRAAQAAVDAADEARRAATRVWSSAREALNAELVRRGKELAGDVVGRQVKVRPGVNLKGSRSQTGRLAIYEPGMPSPFAGGVGDLVVVSDSGKSSQLYRPDVFELEQ